MLVRAVCLGLPEASVPDEQQAWAGATGVADGSSTVTVTAWARSKPRLGWSFRQVCIGVRGRAELGLSLAFAQHLSISSLSCQRRCAFGLSMGLGLGFGCFLRKGEKNTFLTLAVSIVCNLGKDEDRSKVMLEVSSFPALPGAQWWHSGCLRLGRDFRPALTGLSLSVTDIATFLPWPHLLVKQNHS